MSAAPGIALASAVPAGSADASSLYSAPMTDAATPPATDEALMLAFAAGDMTAFDQLYARHRRGLYAFLARQVPASQLDDLFQDVWLRVARHRANYKPTAQFRTWLFQIARNRAIDLAREKPLALVGDLMTAGEDCGDPLDNWADESGPTPEQAVAARQEATQLERALATLPPAQREAFLLREHAELSLEEIAQITGVNAETAKSRLRYALNKLRTALSGIRG